MGFLVYKKNVMNRNQYSTQRNTYSSSAYRSSENNCSFSGSSRPSSGYRSYRPQNRFSSRRRFQPVSINPARYVARAANLNTESSIDTNESFSQYGLHEIILENTRKKNFVAPTRIQSQAIPQALSGNDVLGIAQTGSGKTGAFLMPLIHKVLTQKQQKVLIITPTRELAKQIEDELWSLSRGANIRSALIIGGASMYRQKSSLRNLPQFVIATPGRLKDVEHRRMINLSEFNNIVLDEVDRMLDMGFVHDITEIISKLRPEKQVLFFAATMNEKAESIARSFLKNPVRIQDDAISPQKNVDQDIVQVTSGNKIERLQEILVREEVQKTIIFARTKHGSDSLSRNLMNRGFSVGTIHGGKTQSNRERVIASFRRDTVRILVATDVAARGLDISDITHVINYDEPNTYDDYIHRIGRTGRAGKKGVALTFIER